MNDNLLAVALVAFLLLVCGFFFMRWAIYSPRSKLAKTAMYVWGFTMLLLGMAALVILLVAAQAAAVTSF